MTHTTKKHHGVVVPMISPVDTRGAVDEAGVRRVVDHLVDGGVDGFMVLGTNGEGPSLAASQRRRLVEVAAEQAGGRVRVYVGVGGTSVEETVALGQAALETGADGVVAHLPPYFPLAPEEMVAFYLLLADRIDGPLFVYNMPPTTHMSIPVEALEELSGHPQILGVKDSEKDQARLETVIDRFRDRPDFSVFVGPAVLATHTLAHGADGVVPGSGNLVPGLWRDLYAAARAGRKEEAQGLQERADLIAQAHQRGRTLGQGIAALKSGMALAGLCGPSALPPLRTLAEDERAALRGKLSSLGVV